MGDLVTFYYLFWCRKFDTNCLREIYQMALEYLNKSESWDDLLAKKDYIKMQNPLAFNNNTLKIRFRELEGVLNERALKPGYEQHKI